MESIFSITDDRTAQVLPSGDGVRIIDEVKVSELHWLHM